MSAQEDTEESKLTREQLTQWAAHFNANYSKPQPKTSLPDAASGQDLEANPVSND